VRVGWGGGTPADGRSPSRAAWGGSRGRSSTGRGGPKEKRTYERKRERAPLLAAGASAYLTKPVALLRLLDVVDRFLYAGAEASAIDPAPSRLPT